MRLKKNQWDVQAEIQSRAQNAAQTILYQMTGTYGSNSSPASSMVDMISKAIAAAVAEGFQVLIQNQYTDDDFERDLELK